MTPKINGANKLTDSRFLNMYELDVQHRNGAEAQYYVASRAKNTEDLSAISGEVKPAAVFMMCVHKQRLVLVRQYRYPIGGYVYELPAGLIDEGESAVDAAKREMKEETGLDFIPLNTAWGKKPWLSSPGMTDEACTMICGNGYGEPTNANQEADEDIQVILVDEKGALRILNEETVDVRAAFALISYFNLF